MNLRKDDSLLKDKQGRFRTQSLFWEYKQLPYPFFWTLHEHDIVKDGETIPSLRKIYVSYDHIPEHEYEFAMDMFNSWEHWLRLQNSEMLMPHIRMWREELNIKLKALAVSKLVKAVKNGDVVAAKYVSEGKYSEEVKRGRPSKEERERRLRESQRLLNDVEEDEKRVLSMVGRKNG